MTAKAFCFNYKKERFFFFLISFSAFFTKSFIISGNKYLFLDGYFAVAVTSESMLPRFSLWAF